MATNIRYLNTVEILLINQRICQRQGGVTGVLSLEGLRQSAERPAMCIDGYEPFPGIWEKAAVLMETLMTEKPFLSHNPLTGFFAADIMLRLNGKKIRIQETDIEHIQSVALHQLTVLQIADWLKGSIAEA